jgi:aminoglycoside phosphotransferase (APT) family kinase protein
MHEGELHTDVALVRRLLADQFPQWEELPLDRVASSGTDNALYRLGSDLVVRLPRIEWAAGSLDKEFEWLPRLAPLLTVEISVPLVRGAPAAGYPWEWSVWPWFEGENPVVGGLPDAEGLARELAAFVTALHAVDPDSGPPARRGVPLAQRDRDTRKAIAELEGMIDTKAVTAAWEAALDTPAWAGAPVWIHGDISPGNLLLREGRLAAVIDFAGIGIGDPACDLIVAWNLLPAQVRDLFRTELAVDDATWHRGRGWALSVALIQLPYYKETNPALAANARHVIHEVLAES